MGISQPAPRALTCGGHPRTLPPEASDGLDRETLMPDISAKPENQEPREPTLALVEELTRITGYHEHAVVEALLEARHLVDRHLLEAVYVMLRCRR